MAIAINIVNASSKSVTDHSVVPRLVRGIQEKATRNLISGSRGQAAGRRD